MQEPQHIQGPVTTATNPQRLVALGAKKRKAVRKMVKSKCKK